MPVFTPLPRQRSGLVVQHRENPVSSIINRRNKAPRLAKVPSDIAVDRVKGFLPKRFRQTEVITHDQLSFFSKLLSAGYMNHKEAPINNLVAHELHINNEGSVRIVQNNTTELTADSLRSRKGNPPPKAASIKSEETMHYRTLNEFLEGLYDKTKRLLEAQGQAHLLDPLPPKGIDSSLSSGEPSPPKSIRLSLPTVEPPTTRPLRERFKEALASRSATGHTAQITPIKKFSFTYKTVRKPLP